MTDLRQALAEIRDAAIKHGVNVEVGAAIAHAEVVARLRDGHPEDRNPEAWRMYLLLALFDRRDGSVLGDLVRSCREGYERSGPEMNEDDAWDEFDRLWGSMDSNQRGKLQFGPSTETGRFGPRR